MTGALEPAQLLVLGRNCGLQRVDALTSRVLLQLRHLLSLAFDDLLARFELFTGHVVFLFHLFLRCLCFVAPLNQGVLLTLELLVLRQQLLGLFLEVQATLLDQFDVFEQLPHVFNADLVRRRALQVQLTLDGNGLVMARLNLHLDGALRPQLVHGRMLDEHVIFFHRLGGNRRRRLGLGSFEILLLQSTGRANGFVELRAGVRRNGPVDIDDVSRRVFYLPLLLDRFGSPNDDVLEFVLIKIFALIVLVLTVHVHLLLHVLDQLLRMLDNHWLLDRRVINRLVKRLLHLLALDGHVATLRFGAGPAFVQRAPHEQRLFD